MIAGQSAGAASDVVLRCRFHLHDAESGVTPSDNVTSVGVGTDATVEPIPSCPVSLLPQQRTLEPSRAQANGP